jgi:hypothetical protein
MVEGGTGKSGVSQNDPKQPQITQMQGNFRIFQKNFSSISRRFRTRLAAQ